MAADFDLESLVHLEQTFYDDGHQDGFAHGRIHGLIEGRALGREKGFEMWEELGFYEGFALIWKTIYIRDGRQDDRGFHHINHLLDLISQFARTNPSSEPSDLDILKLLSQIRSRYKALCASLGVKPSLRANVPAPSREEEDEANDPDVDRGKKIWSLNDVSDTKAGLDMSF